MVAIIHTSSSLQRALNYNEQKVNEKVATCLAAGNYPKDLQDLSFNQKLNRLLKQAQLNIKTMVNSVHISLNFDPSEKLSPSQLTDIAKEYLQKISFGGQPYLLYQHHDSGHPHVHIVTTNIKPDGRRIELHNLGRNQSEKARKEIEQSFDLIRAEDSKQREAYTLKPVKVQRVLYGRGETRRAIANVLNAVLPNYKFASLPELNAVLKQYNIIADRGSERSRIFTHQGLVYRVLDDQGNKVGVPIKASAFYNKPTLSYLEDKYSQNELAKQQYKARVKNVIDVAILKHAGLGLTDLVKAIDNAGINAVIRQNDQGIIYGVTYVDHQTKCVFNGSDLGKQYSAKGILERLEQVSITLSNKDINHRPPSKESLTPEQVNQLSSTEKTMEGFEVLEALLRKESTYDYVPNQLTSKGRKKKRKRNSLKL